MSKPDSNDSGGGQDNKFTVTVTFNGLSKQLEVNKNQATQALITHALALFNQSADAVGLFLGAAEIPAHGSVEAAGVTSGAILVLRPRQVRGG